MIKNLCIILIYFLSFNNLKAQNLVPNYSFEEYNFLPKNVMELDSACKYWFTPWALNPNIQQPFGNGTGSSEYFNVNAKKWVCDIPKNAFGYQYSYSGNAYAGFGLSSTKESYITLVHTYKENIEIQLKENLISGQEYCVELYYNIANYIDYYYNTIDTIPYYPIKIGFLLTDTIVKRYLQQGVKQPLNICATPNYEASLVSYKDTVNWNKISGHFTAKGGEQYLTIGNFECNPTDYNPDSVGVYIYIDNVRLYQCNPDSNSIVDSMIVPNIFTPNGDGYNDIFEFTNQEQWEFETQIFGRWGNLVFDNKNSENWDGTYQGDRVSSGVYFYVIKAVAIKTGEIKVYRGTVTVLY